jgi:hypothetical protein
MHYFQPFAPTNEVSINITTEEESAESNHWEKIISGKPVKT